MLNWRFLALAALLLLGFVAKDALVAPPSLETTKASTGFDGQAAVGRLARILGDQRPHPVDTPANSDVRDRLLAEIRAIGYAPEVRDDFFCRQGRWGGAGCARVQNVVFRAGPAGGEAMMLAAHYDSVPAGPGASDDGQGVAALLEVASRLKAQTLTKPVIFLITDGEEMGLIGAASFVRRDPWAKDVAFAINLEARGTGGPAIMFQTSAPNSRDIDVLSHGQASIVANSMAADIYRALPNDTDATEFLAKGWDVLNFAYIDPVARYHTPLDNLQFLDQRSLAQGGGAALRAAEAYAVTGVANSGKETQQIYADIAGRTLIVLPQWAGVVSLIAGVVVAMLVYWRAGNGLSWRAAAGPLLAAMLATLLAFSTSWAMGQVKAGELWWTGAPDAARAMLYSMVLLGGAAALWFASGSDPLRVAAGGWIVFLGLMAAATFYSPGSGILMAPAALAFVVFGLLALALRRWALLLLLVPAAIALVQMLPVLGFLEAGLGIGSAWFAAPIAALLVYVSLAPTLTNNRERSWLLAPVATAAIACSAWAFASPSYTRETPKPMNLQHVVTAKGDAVFVLSPTLGPIPKELAAAGFSRRAVEGMGDTPRHVAPASAHGLVAPSLEVESETTLQDKRRLTLRVRSNGADQVQVWAPEAAGLTLFESGGETMRWTQAGDRNLTCTGAACADWRITVEVAAKPTDWRLRGAYWGGGEAVRDMIALRPPWAGPVHDGDTRVALGVART